MNKISDVTRQLQELNDTTLELTINTEDVVGQLRSIDSNLFELANFLFDESQGTFEERREQARQNEQMLAALEGIASGGGVAGGGGDAEEEGSGLLGGLGLAGAGIGIGAAGFGALLAGGGFLLDKMMEIDGELIKQNIVALLSIPEEVSGGTLGFLAEGGGFAVTMAGLGVGLAAFALGSGVASAVNFFTKDSTFAATVKENVKQLLSISDEVGGNLNMLAEGGAFTLAMTGLGIGLGVFGLGAGIAGLSDALNNFANPDWAQSIKDNVVTLLSIGDAAGGTASALAEGAAFIPIMSGLATGLAIFGIGSSIAGIGSAISNFSDPAWAQSIKDNVLVLLSISDSLGGKLEAFGETGTFVAIMGGLATGLSVFAVGQAATGIAQTISRKDWTETLKANVASLLSITDMLDGDGEDSRAGRFAAGMAKIAAGLLAFTASKAIGQLANVGEKVLGFFGVDSPFDQIMQVADQSEKLTKGANAIEKIADALGKFGSIDVATGDVDFEKLAKNLGRSIPLIRKLATGGTYDPGFLSREIDFGAGLLDPSLRLDELAAQVAKVNFVLGRSSSPIATTPLSTDRRPSGQLGMAAEERSALENEVTGAGAGVNVQNNSSTNVQNNNQTVVKPIPGPTRPPRTARDVQYDF